MSSEPRFQNLLKKLRKLRRDPEMFVYDMLRKRVEARPAQTPRVQPRRRVRLPNTAPSTRRQLDADFSRFRSDLEREGPGSLVFLFSGTTHIQDIRGNRPIRLARMFRQLNAAVVFSFFRWRDTDHVPSYGGDLLFQTPIDYTMGAIDRIARIPFPGRRKLFVLGFPFPSLMPSLDRLNAAGWSTLYDCRDDWELFHEAGQAPWYLPEAESYAVSHCDRTCCVSGTLVRKMHSLVPEARVELSPNALDEQFVSKDYEHRPSSSPVVGYFGHLSSAWFNWPVLIEIALQRSSYRFEIIGHSGPEDLALPRNVALLGPKNRSQICELASRWRAAIIPFKIGPLSDAVDPIKIYEYLALRLPVVSFRMPQIDGYPHTSTVDTVPAFLRALDDAVDEACDEEEVARFLSANTWERRARQMLAWADETGGGDSFKRLIEGA